MATTLHMATGLRRWMVAKRAWLIVARACAFPLQYCAGTNAIGVCGGSFIGSGLAAVQVGSCTVQPNTELADSHYPGLGVWFMLSGAYFFFALFVSLLSLKDFFVIDLFGLSVYQNGDCEPETQLQEENGLPPGAIGISIVEALHPLDL